MSKPNQITPRAGAGGAVDIGGRMEGAKAALAQAETPRDALRIEAAARAMRELASTQSITESRQIELEAAELTMRAMRRTGELLPEPQPGRREPLPRVEEVDSGLTPAAVSRRRAIAAIPAADFEDELAAARAASRPASQTALLALAKRLAAPRAGAPPDLSLDSPAQKKLKRQRARALLDAVAAIDACQAELVRLADLTLDGLCDPLDVAAHAIDAARTALLRDERCAPALKKGPKPPAESPVAAWDRKNAQLAEDDGEQAAIEAGEDFDPSVDPTDVGVFPDICPDCNGDSPLAGHAACARCESTGLLLDGKPYHSDAPGGDA